jgi:hypothetical protein
MSQRKRKDRIGTKRKSGANQTPRGNNEHMNNNTSSPKKQALNGCLTQVILSFGSLEKCKELLIVQELSTAKKLATLGYRAIAISPLAIRPSAVRLESKARAQGYVVDDLLNGIRLGGRIVRFPKSAIDRHIKDTLTVHPKGGL